jgi:hypothetical protein
MRRRWHGHDGGGEFLLEKESHGNSNGGESTYVFKAKEMILDSSY